MHRLKICPKCAYTPNWSETAKISRCPYCRVELINTKVFVDKFHKSPKVEMIQDEYRAREMYDPEAEKETWRRIGIELEAKFASLGKRLPAPVQCPFCNGDLTTVHKVCPHCGKNVEGLLEYPEQTTPSPTLITCPVCQGKLSTAATACPHCGQPMSNGKAVTQPTQPTQPVRQEPRS